MDDLLFVKAALEKYTYPALKHIADETGIPASTIGKVKGGRSRDHRYQTIKKLANYFHAKASRERSPA